MGPLLLYVPVQLLPDCTLSLSDQSPSPTRARSGRPPDSAKRAAIIDAAGARFFELGFAATSIEQIAQDAGVSKVTVYKHFGDKDALFAAAVQRECENMRGVLAIEDLHAGSLRERLTAIGEEMLGFLSRSKMVQFERRIAAETEQNPALGKAFMESGPYAMLDAFTALLDEMAQRGEIVVDDRRMAAEQFVAMCKGLGDLELRFGVAPDPVRNRQRIECAVEAFCRAYGA